mgnify:FL=1
MEIGVVAEMQVIEHFEKNLKMHSYIPLKDRGIDFIAVKDEKFFNIQVKASRFLKNSYFWFDLVLEKMFYSKNTFYIFNCFVNERRTFMGKKRNFLVIPSNKIKSWIKDKDILVSEKKKSGGQSKTPTIRFFVYPDFQNKKWFYIGGAKTDKKKIDLTNYLNNFDELH